jgi:hypothetical protein
MKEIVIKVWGSNTYKRTYFNTVSCNGTNLIAPWGAAGNSYRDVEVLGVIDGGYDYGNGSHAWEATYTLRIRCPEDARIERQGRQINGSSGFQIISEQVLA